MCMAQTTSNYYSILQTIFICTAYAIEDNVESAVGDGRGVADYCPASGV